MTVDEQPESPSRILPLVSDSGNRQVLIDWIEDHPAYEPVDVSAGVQEADYDVCVLDKTAFEEHVDVLRAKKTATAPVLLPYLLMLPESGSEIIEKDSGQLADNVVTETIDELVTMPIQQAELHWRLAALVRLRDQSRSLRKRTHELERQVDLFEKAQNIANVGAWEYDIDAEQMWWTDEARRIHALPEDTPVSPDRIFQYYHQEDRQRIQDAFVAALENGEPYDLELRLIDAEDNLRWVRAMGEPQSENGEITRIRGTVQDITDRKERERELQRIQQAVEASGHSIYVTETDGTIAYVNQAFEETTGFAKEEVIGETPHVLNSGEMSDDYFESLWDTLFSGEIWEEEITNQRKNGELYTAIQTIAPVTDGGEIHGFVAVHDDITERKAREEQLRQRRRAIDEAPIGIVIADPEQEDNPLIYVNDTFVDMTGYQREAVLGENCRFLQGANTDPERVTRINDAIESREPITIDIRNYRKDGTEFWNNLKIAPVRDDAGDVINFIGFVMDVTKRKERQRQLEVLDRVLRHNLRNNMNVVGGYAETIHSQSSGEVSAYAEEIMDVSADLAGLAEKERKITELLRADSPNEEVDVGDLLEEVASPIESEEPNATIAVTCPDDVTVHVPAKFGQAITELATNAIVHNDSSSPDVEIDVTQTDETVRIDVADTGPDIPEVERGMLDGNTDQTALYHGSGLGLWLVDLIISRSGGTISVGKNDPVGNIVSLELPQ